MKREILHGLKFRMVFLTVFVLNGLLLNGFLCTVVAQDISLDANDSRNRQTVNVKLYDNNDGGFLFSLPLTFHLNKENILFMIVGDDNELGVNNAVLMFDKTVGLQEFLKQNKNVAASKTFKKQNARLIRFYDQSENVEKHAFFDHGFESVTAAPRPVFFRIKDPAKPALLKLTFYVTSFKGDGVHTLTSESGQIKITVNLQNNS